METQAERHRRLLIEAGHADIAEVVFEVESMPKSLLPLPATPQPPPVPARDTRPARPQRRKQGLPPEQVKPLTEKQVANFADIFVSRQKNHRIPLGSFLNGLLAVVVGGIGWSEANAIVPGIRRRFHRERAKPERWVEFESRARRRFNAPMSEHLVRVARFCQGDYSGRARRPQPYKMAVRKYGRSLTPRFAPPDE